MFSFSKNLTTTFSHPEILITAPLKLKGDVQLEECKWHSEQAEEHTAQRIAQHILHINLPSVQRYRVTIISCCLRYLPSSLIQTCRSSLRP